MTELRLPRHGRNHVCGGSDPIPGLCDGLLPPQTSGNFPATILGLSDIRGYWRLGDGAEPFLDTSGNTSGPHNMRINPGVAGRPAMTQDVTPGLLPPATDDGAVAFNYIADEPTGPGQYLQNPTGAGATQFNFNGTATMSAVALIKPTASTHTNWGGVVGDFNPVIDLNGWALRVKYPTMEVDFVRAHDSTHYHSATAPPITAGETSLIVGTYDGVLIRLYVNGVLAASVADTSSLTYTLSNSVEIGTFEWIAGAYSTWYTFFGAIDEVAIYGSVLSDANVAALYSAATAVPAGSVPISDGSGGVAWGPLPPADPATATRSWFPLVDSDGTCVLDASGALIPTLIPL